MAYHVHIICLLASCHSSRWRERWWCNHIQQSCQSDSQRSGHTTGCFQGHLGTMWVACVATETGFFSREVGASPSVRVVSKTSFFKRNRDAILTLTKCCFYLSLNRAYSQLCDENTNAKLQHKVTSSFTSRTEVTFIWTFGSVFALLELLGDIWLSATKYFLLHWKHHHGSCESEPK